MSRLPKGCIITRLRLDACFSDPVSSTTRRNALKGPRQPKLSARLLDPHTHWQKQTRPLYGGTTREMAFATGTALWFQSPIPPVAIRWVLVRDPQGPSEPLALLWTDQHAEAHQIVAWFVLRWTVDGRHLSRGVCASGCRDAAPMVGCGHGAHHSGLVCALFSGHGLRSSVAGCPALSRSSGGLVRQSLAHLCRCSGFGSHAVLPRFFFLRVAWRKRHHRSSTLSASVLWCG